MTKPNHPPKDIVSQLVEYQDLLQDIRSPGMFFLEYQRIDDPTRIKLMGYDRLRHLN